MSTGDCFIVLPKDGGSVEAGSWVEVQPFYGLI
jgi:molybdopterin biosynthesis enzyme